MYIMKLIFKGAVFHILCIIVFFLIYFNIPTHFTKSPNPEKFIPGELIDFVFLSTTVEAGVGYSGLLPITTLSKSLLIIQQIVMVTTNIFLLYIFTL